VARLRTLSITAAIALMIVRRRGQVSVLIQNLEQTSTSLYPMSEGLGAIGGKEGGAPVECIAPDVGWTVRADDLLLNMHNRETLSRNVISVNMMPSGEPPAIPTTIL
jgi:hypothetical protein